MSITVELGNLLDNAVAGKYDAIMHGCNCQGTPENDSGIAAQIWKKFPIAAIATRNWTLKGDFTTFGSYSKAKVSNLPFTIINAYTQYYGGPCFYLPALINVLKVVNKEFKGKTIGIPLIGCGVGGGDWVEVQQALLVYAPDVNWRVVIWK